MNKSMFCNASIIKMFIELFVAIFMGMLSSKAATASSVVTPSSDLSTANPGIADAFVMDAKCLNRNELIDQVKDLLESKFQQHVSKSKAEREDQHEAIAILKASKKAQGEKLKLVLNEMEILKTQNRDQLARIVQLEEILKTKHDATSAIRSVAKSNNVAEFGQTIPSSCEDLKSNGHHLNGIYMVFDTNLKKVLAIYCDFYQSTATITKAIDKIVIGSLGINTLVGGVYFYAQMQTTFKEVGKVVPFDRILVNKGNGLSPSNKGVFTAPRAGIYHFTFKGNNWGPFGFLNTKLLVIEIRHNGVIVGDTAAPVGILHVHATLKLKAGDKISIFKSTAGDLYTDFKTPDTHFSGWLMEEDVSII